MGKRTGLALAGAAFLILANSLAWACTKQAELIGLSPQSAPPFTQIRVVGKLNPASSVEIKWNSLEGRTLGIIRPEDTDASGNFSVPITIPSIAPGIYSVVVTGPEYGIARAAIEVVPGTAGRPENQQWAGKSVSGDLWSGVNGSVPRAGSPAPAPVEDSFSMSIWAGILLLAAGFAGITSVALIMARKGRGIAGPS